MRAATRLKIEEIFEERNLKPCVAIEVENVDLIKKLVKEEKGYCVLSELWLKEEILKGELIPLRLKDGRVFLDIDAIWRKDESLSMADATFLDFLREGVKN
jgi:DNA-binding transcriptional LysR family regulator